MPGIRVKAWDDMTFDEKIAESIRRDERKKAGLPIQPTPAEIAERTAEEDRRLEKIIQEELVDMLLAYSFKVWRLSQARATKQSAGLGDVYALHVERRRILWLETKTPAGEQSPAQVDFEQYHAQMGIAAITVLVGGKLALEEYLISIGAAERMATGAIEPTRRI